MSAICGLLLVVALAAASPVPAPDVRHFYDEKIGRHVDRIAEQVAAFNAHAHHHHHPQPHDEEMQSDQPQADAGVQMALLRRQLDAHAMRSSIRERVMSFIGAPGAAGTRDRSFYAACGGAEEGAAGGMRLQFVLPPLEGDGVVAMASLRLHRRAANRSDASATMVPAACDGGDLFRVTAYAQLGRAASAHKPVRRRLLDSRVVGGVATHAHVDLNVLAGVRDLPRAAKGSKLHVLTAVVELEDQFGGALDAGEFFAPPQCAAPTPPPIPTAFEEAYLGDSPPGGAHQQQQQQPPKLDVRTIDGAGAACAPAPTLRHAAHHGARQQGMEVNDIRALLERAGRSRQSQVT